MEFDYCNCAKNCGIEIPEVKLIPSKKFGKFFAIKRFDRQKISNTKTEKVYKISSSSLLNTSHLIPAMDYNNCKKSQNLFKINF